MKRGRSRRQNLGGSWPGAAAAQTWLGSTLPMLCLLARPVPAVMAQAIASPPPLRTQLDSAHCPPQDLSALVTQLMRDLPSYGNRIIQRASKMGDTTPLYLIVAGQAEISPVALEAMGNEPSRSRLPADESNREGSGEEIYQIFFTTLERQYRLSSTPALSNVEQTLSQAAPSFQQYHWLILARKLGDQVSPDPAPWRIISLRSQLAPYPNGDDERLAPARDSRPGAVGQGIVVWLRDWYSGAIRLSAVDIDSSAAHGTESTLPCLSP